MAPDPLARERLQLLSRIHRRYVTVTQTVRIEHVEFPFTRIADPDRLLDQIALEAERQERLTGRRTPDEHLHLPYWAELWDSALGVGQFLVGVSASPCLRVSASVSPTALDLGCGMGLAGTVAAALGMRVLFADLEPAALVFARLNSLPWSTQVRTRRLNWRRDRLGERFDLILGADILYEREQWQFLEPFWRGHLAPGGTVLLAEPGRQTGDQFAGWITGKNWDLKLHEEPIPNRSRSIRIFQIERIRSG